MGIWAKARFKGYSVLQTKLKSAIRRNMASVRCSCWFCCMMMTWRQVDAPEVSNVTERNILHGTLELNVRVVAEACS